MSADLPMPILRVMLADGSEHQVPRGDEAVILWMREAIAREVILRERIVTLEAPGDAGPFGVPLFMAAGPRPAEDI